MRYFTGFLAAGGLVLAMAGESRAQMGTPAGFSYGYPNYSSYGTAGPAYSGLSAGSMGYSRGYGGLTASSYLAGLGTPTWGGTGYGYRPGYAGPSPYYSASNGAYPRAVYQPNYYRPYSYGSRGGFRPFRMFR